MDGLFPGLDIFHSSLSSSSLQGLCEKNLAYSSSYCILLHPHYALFTAAILLGLSVLSRQKSRMILLLAACALAAFSFVDITASLPSPRNADYHSNAGVLRYVNPRIGTFGYSPNGNGGMIPSVSPPFGMTRWTPQTRENFISQCPYHDADTYMHGFQATHQPAIWMGESGQVVLSPGLGDVRPLFEQRGMSFSKSSESSTPYVYEVTLNADSISNQGWNLTEQYAGSGPVPGGAGRVPDTVEEGANGRMRISTSRSEDVPRDMSVSEDMYVSLDQLEKRSSAGNVILVAQTATSHVGHLRLDYNCGAESPHVFIQATRQNWTGHVNIDPSKREISGSNPQRQDYKLGPQRAPNFRGYFVSRFSEPFESYGTAKGGNVSHGAKSDEGTLLGAYATFATATKRVEVGTGVSFASVDQARENLDLEIPDGTAFENTVEQLKSDWLSMLGRIIVEGVNETSSDHDQRTIFYTGLFHNLQYPNDYSEPTSKGSETRTFYSGYTDSVHTAQDSYHQSWSIWVSREIDAHGRPYAD